jgi:drug/metabolite transporter (DMT)-like permease
MQMKLFLGLLTRSSTTLLITLVLCVLLTPISAFSVTNNLLLFSTTSSSYDQQQHHSSTYRNKRNLKLYTSRFGKFRRHARSDQQRSPSHLFSLSDKQFASSEDDRNLGLLVLLTVPFAWGSFEPAVRYVYEIDPPLPALVFSLGYYLVAATSLGFLTLLASSTQQDQKGSEVEESTQIVDQTAIRGGMELGTYLFIGNGLQVLGLATVSADRAAFLLQLTTLFVPLVQGLVFNGDLKSISSKTWTACVVALIGVAVISLDGKEGPILDNAANILTNFSQGDIFIMAAAFSYTFHCIRLERFAKETPALQLAACKATTETVWTLVLIATIFGIASQSSGGSAEDLPSLLSGAQATSSEIASFFQSDTSLLSNNPALPSVVLAILWTGLVTVAYTIYAQSFGQSRVSPTDANLIYTIQPICTAVFAWILLGETLGPAGYVGGALIGSAVYLVAVDDGGGSEILSS